MPTTSRQKRKIRRVSSQQESNSYKMDLLSFKPFTRKQEEFWNLMNKNTVVVAHGAAGTGKTLLALWYGLSLVNNNLVDKVIYVRSDVGVEFQRGRGALPGDFNEKIKPLLGPVLDNLPVMVKSTGMAEYLISKNIIEPVLLEDVRGRSFNNSFVIVDEAQNLLPTHVKTCLTRLGQKSKMVLIGDTKQADLETFRRNNGLLDAVYRLQNLKNVGIIKFDRTDSVRNSIISDVLERYEDGD
jgi:phosphate starvation-inducible protein PhoH and related proteins